MTRSRGETGRVMQSICWNVRPDPVEQMEGSPAAGQHSALYVFGASIVGTGNTFLATGSQVSVSPPDFNERFSNGCHLALTVFRRDAGIFTSLRPGAEGQIWEYPEPGESTPRPTAVSIQPNSFRIC